MHVWDEFSEFLPENRVPTSADFNTFPIRIFDTQTIWQSKLKSYQEKCKCSQNSVKHGDINVKFGQFGMPGH